jgi:hypothetical protein
LPADLRPWAGTLFTINLAISAPAMVL